jgi:hypothetical protein
MIKTVLSYTFPIQQCKDDKDKARLRIKDDLDVQDVDSVTPVQKVVLSMETERQVNTIDCYVILKILTISGGNTLERLTTSEIEQMFIKSN